MAGNIAPEKRQGYRLAGEAGGIVKGILLVLLALAACLGYFYFFTDLLRSKEEVPAQPDVYSSEVKKPLPERSGTLAKMEPAPAASPPSQEDKTAPAGGEPPVKPVTPSAASKPQVPPSAVPSAGKKAPTPAPQPATKASGAAKDTKTAAATVPPIAKPGLSSTVAKEVKLPEKPKTAAAKPKPGSEKPAAAAVKEPAKTPEKPRSVPTADRKKAPAEAKSTAAAGAERKPAGRYTLQVGTYVLKATMLSDKAKLEKAGFDVRVTTGAKKSEPMNRLLVAEFSSYSSASSELGRLGKLTKGAFMLRERGKFAVYAGSYFSRERAVEEQGRLRAKGFAPIIRSSEAPVATYTLASGSFATREEAEQHAGPLRKLGFKPIPLQLAKQ